MKALQNQVLNEKFKYLISENYQYSKVNGVSEVKLQTETQVVYDFKFYLREIAKLINCYQNLNKIKIKLMPIKSNYNQIT